MHWPQMFTWAVLALLLFWGVGAYNRLLKSRHQITHAFAQIDVQFKRRHELIPSLIDVARQYLGQEREALERLSAARNQIMAACDLVRASPGQAGPVKSLALAEEVMGSALRGFLAVVDATPELKADAMLRQLGEELAQTENKVAFSRQLFNDATTAYNQAVAQCPTRLIAGLFRLSPAPLLQATPNDLERVDAQVGP